MLSPHLPSPMEYTEQSLAKAQHTLQASIAMRAMVRSFEYGPPNLAMHIRWNTPKSCTTTSAQDHAPD